MAVEWWVTIKFIAGGSKAVYDYVELESLISSIRKELNQTYSDIAEASFEAAQAAFRAAHNSRNVDQEVRNGIGHLRSAFFTYQKLLTKTRTTGFLFFKFEEPALDYDEDYRVKEKLSELATIIALNYAQLREQENAREWKQFAWKYFELSEEVFLEKRHWELRKDLEAIKRINSAYVNEVRVQEATRSYITRYYTELELSPSGEKYLERQIKELKEARAESFNTVFAAKLIS